MKAVKITRKMYSSYYSRKCFLQFVPSSQLNEMYQFRFSKIMPDHMLLPMTLIL